MMAVNTDNGLEMRKRAYKLQKAGNYKDALELFKKLVLTAEQDPRQVGPDLDQALNCFRRLNQLKDIDSFREEVIKQRSENWRLLQTAARSYLNNQHYGFMIAGEFERGPHRGRAKMVNAVKRDRIRALQLYTQALPVLKRNSSPAEQASLQNISQREEAMQTFLRQVESSLTHLQQTQLQNLNESQPGRPLWLMELPIKDGQDIDLFELRISEEESTQAEGETKKIWNVTLKFDLNGLGKIKAHIKMQNDFISAQFFSEKPETLVLFREIGRASCRERV